MIECEGCKCWYHGKCVGVSKRFNNVNPFCSWTCPSCSPNFTLTQKDERSGSLGLDLAQRVQQLENDKKNFLELKTFDNFENYVRSELKNIKEVWKDSMSKEVALVSKFEELEGHLKMDLKNSLEEQFQVLKDDLNVKNQTSKDRNSELKTSIQEKQRKHLNDVERLDKETVKEAHKNVPKPMKYRSLSLGNQLQQKQHVKCATLSQESNGKLFDSNGKEHVQKHKKDADKTSRKKHSSNVENSPETLSWNRKSYIDDLDPL